MPPTAASIAAKALLPIEAKEQAVVQERILWDQLTQEQRDLGQSALKCLWDLREMSHGRPATYGEAE